jgi:nucleotide-binding universal stress UspA family protein
MEVNMYQTILVPLDGSERAEMILPHVKDIATHYKSTVYFLKVEEEPIHLGWDEVIDEKRYHVEFEERRSLSEAYLAEWKTDFEKDDIEAHTKVAYGPVVKTILSAADEVNSDLIALASHGLSALPRMSYGSVAAGLLQHLDRPLLIIRSENGKEKSALC